MINKICNKCNLEQVIANFPRNGKYIKNQCHKCIGKYGKEYRKNNIEKVKYRGKIWRAKNKPKIETKAKRYRERRNILEAKRYHERKNTDVQYKLKKLLRGRLSAALRNNYKVGSAVDQLGCSIENLKSYLENKFEEGMNWHNHGNSGWHIDHKIPLNSFNLENKEQLLKACHYTNLQPLWAKDNLQKGCKYVTE